MRLSIELRHLIGNAIDRGIKKSSVARVVGVTRKTVRKWANRRKHLKDRKRRAKGSKITYAVDRSIVLLRTCFEWGTARIQQGIYSLPSFMREALQDIVQGVKLSRQAINNVLKKHRLNGYKKGKKEWKFVHAKKPNEIWQIDLKGPVHFRGRKYYYLVVIDDYSRYIFLTKQLDHCPTAKEVQKLLQSLVDKYKPESIIADNGPQFKKQWKRWCKKNKIVPISAHPYYPQDKGKVERSIRTLTEEFIKIMFKFPEWIENKVEEWKIWYNEQRYHRGIASFPATLFKVDT